LKEERGMQSTPQETFGMKRGSSDQSNAKSHTESAGVT